MMNADELRALLVQLEQGRLSVNACLKKITRTDVEDLGFARVDIDRDRRCGFPEVIFAQGKTPAEITGIARTLLKHHPKLLVTRADRKAYHAVKKHIRKAVYHARARCITIDRDKRQGVGAVLVICAGTSDLPVAEEAKVTAEIRGANVETLYDVGIAGVHRLLSETDLLKKARVLIVVAGMEGALPSVVAGLVSRPVIAVPTSVGYGASFGGVAALLAMLNSCATGVSVVNIDNGFAAGCIAAMINETEGPVRQVS